MVDLSRLAAEYIGNKTQAGILMYRIETMQKGRKFLSGIPEVDLTEDERKIRDLIRSWRKKLFELELSICRYDLVVGAIDSRERIVLHLYYEKGLSMRKISGMNLQKYAVDNMSVSTLNRVRKALVAKFNEQYRDDARRESQPAH